MVLNKDTAILLFVAWGGEGTITYLSSHMQQQREAELQRDYADLIIVKHEGAPIDLSWDLGVRHGGPAWYRHRMFSDYRLVELMAIYREGNPGAEPLAIQGPLFVASGRQLKPGETGLALYCHTEESLYGSLVTPTEYESTDIAGN